MENLKERLEEAGATQHTVEVCVRIHLFLGKLAAEQEPEPQAIDLERRDYFFERVVTIAASGDLGAYAVRYYAAYRERSLAIAFQMLVDGLSDPEMGELRIVPDGTYFANWNQLHGWKWRCYRRLP